MDLLNFTIEIALKAGSILRKYYGAELEIETKTSYRDVVTQADKETEKFLVEQIRAKFPEHQIVGEEGMADDLELIISDKTPNRLANYRWIIDPLDGTTNFTKKLPIFAISIALEKDGELLVGCIYNPVLNQLWYAEHGQGAYLAWNLDGSLQNLQNLQKIAKKLHVSTILELKDAVLATGFIPSNRINFEHNLELFKVLGEKGRAIRRCGSAALDLAFVATGWLDGFWEFDLNSWDIAAGALIAQEAGASVTNYDGSDLDLDGGNILVSNGLIHQEMMTYLKKQPNKQSH